MLYLLLVVGMLCGLLDGLAKLNNPRGTRHKSSKNLVDFLFFNYE